MKILDFLYFNPLSPLWASKNSLRRLFLRSDTPQSKEFQKRNCVSRVKWLCDWGERGRPSEKRRRWKYRSSIPRSFICDASIGGRRAFARRGIGRSARRALVVAALTAIQAVIHYRFLRFPPILLCKKRRQIPNVSVFFLVTRRGIEPLSPPWEGGVLTAWPTGHIYLWNEFYYITKKSKLQ